MNSLWTLVCTSGFICLLYAWVIAEDSDILSIISTPDGDFCLTNSSSAMYYTTSTNDVGIEGHSFFRDRWFICESEDRLCFPTWKSQYTLILDDRWEHLPIKKLPYITKLGERAQLLFTTLVHLNEEESENFKITMSLRGKEVHLLLCDGEYVRSASCYWFALQGWRQTFTALRICNPGEINGRYPHGECLQRNLSLRHPDEFPLYMNNESWSHIILEKNGKNVFLKRYKEKKEVTLIQFIGEKYKMFQLKYILGHSGKDDAYCKVHKRYYFSTNNRVKKGMSTSLDLHKCPDCFDLVRSGENNFEETIPQSNGFWQYQKIFIEVANTSSTNVELELITLVGRAYAREGGNVWSSDKLRVFLKEEFRTTPKDKRGVFECRLLTGNKSVRKENAIEYTLDTNCSLSSSAEVPCKSCRILQPPTGKKCNDWIVYENLRVSHPRKTLLDSDNFGRHAVYASLVLLVFISVICGFLIIYKHPRISKHSMPLRDTLDFLNRILPSTKECDDSLSLKMKDNVPLDFSHEIEVESELSSETSTFPANSTTELCSKPVAKADFEKYVKTSIERNELDRQFAALPQELTKPGNGQLVSCKPKNPSDNIVLCDHNRVKLRVDENKKGHDYINASYIKGFKKTKSYIATQGPKSSTINEFWLMVWQEKISYIVMLVNLEESGVKKVEKYWPNYNEDFQYGEIHVHFDSSEVHVDYEIRIFTLVCNSSERKVFQYHFLSWPDDGVPIPFQRLVPFIKKTLEIFSKTPILVHCCSGSSATGVFILCHICLQMTRKSGTLDVLKVAHQLREQRVNIIHNAIQYKLAHLVILECLSGLHGGFSCRDDIDKFLAELTKYESLSSQMKYLKDLIWRDRVLLNTSDYEQPQMPVYHKKNKVHSIMPGNDEGVELQRYPAEDESSWYINAVRVDGYQCRQRYIVTQQPMPNTMNDFWRMIVEQETKIIVSLNEIDLEDKKSCAFWPTVDTPIMSPVDFIIIRHISTDEGENYESTTIQVEVYEKKKKSMKVRMIVLKGWKPENKHPGNIQTFLKFFGFVDSLSRRMQNTVVTCYDGCTASGIYVTTSYLIEMIKLQKNFNVWSAIRAIRRNREQFIVDEGQLAFLYEVSATYIRGYQDYANFGSTSEESYNIYEYVE